MNIIAAIGIILIKEKETDYKLEDSDHRDIKKQNIYIYASIT